MRFFRRKSEVAGKSGSDGTISLASKPPSDSLSRTLSKSSRTSKCSKSTKSTKNTLPIDEPVEEINPQSVEVLPRTIEAEARDDIFFINSITTSSGSTETEEDEMSNITFDAQGMTEKTSQFKQYLVDHLLGCVDFIEECAVNVKDTRNEVNESNGIRSGADMMEESERREVAPSNKSPPLCTQVIPCSAIQELEMVNDNQTDAGVIENAQREIETGKASHMLCNVDLPGRPSATQRSEIYNDSTMPNENKPNEPAQMQDLEITPMVNPSEVQQSGTTPASYSPAASSNDLIELADPVPESSYENIMPQSPISLQTNNDFLLAATNIDAIIDSHVARMCEQMCVCSELGLCDGDDDISQFQELPLVSDDNENMLFQ